MEGRILPYIKDTFDGFQSSNARMIRLFRLVSENNRLITF